MTAISPPVPVEMDANAHLPSAVPTTAVGCPGVDMVTGRSAGSSLPAATLVEHPAFNAAAGGCGALEEHAPKVVTTATDAITPTDWRKLNRLNLTTGLSSVALRPSSVIAARSDHTCPNHDKMSMMMQCDFASPCA